MPRMSGHRWRVRWWMCLLSSLLLAQPGRADPVEDTRIWANITAQGGLARFLPVDARWKGYLELQPRLREEGEDTDQLLLRPALGWQVSDAGSLWLGYAHVWSFPDTGDTTHEDRVWQQYLHNVSVGQELTLASRTRLEQRWMDTGDEVGVRLRQMIRLTRPVGAVHGLSLIASNEVFLNANDTDWGARSGFDQNRAYLGIGYAVSAAARLELGYLNQYLRARGDDRMNHVISTGLFLSF